LLQRCLHYACFHQPIADNYCELRGPLAHNSKLEVIEMKVQVKALTEREACRYLSVSRSFLAQGRIYGHLPGRTPTPPFYKVGRMVRYRVEDLDAWLEAYRQSPKGGEHA